ncbi:MobF family relaxase [Pseudonocardia alni]|uniref:MobF family relaxase n=1 Tax=Pseudonocardia alni TaxID=33907 RepID=UPI00280C205B|nr:MobF family relaxase [Pseudonocardia alni]
MGVVRVTAMAPGSVEYLLHGCDSRPEQSHGRGPEQGVENAGDGFQRTPSAAEYLTSAAERGEPDGVWFGAGIEALGLPFEAGDTATADDVRAVFGQLRYPEHVLAGSTEKTPIYLGSKPRRFRTAAQIVADALKEEPNASAERRFEIETSANRNTRTPTAYYDVTFSPVKSVSMYYTALLAAGDNAGAETVRWAHDEAVQIALSSVQPEVAYVRSGRHEGRGPSGRTVGQWEAATGLAAVVYRHHTNRDGEPQLHSHVGVLNRAATPDGRVLALDGQAFRPVKEALSAAYTRAYQQLLTERMGVLFQQRPDGLAREIAGFDPELLAQASTRTLERVRPAIAELVESYTARHGRAPGPRARRALVEQAVKGTREPKRGLAGPAAVLAWTTGRPGRVARLTAALDAVDEVAMYAAANGSHPVTAHGGLAPSTDGRQAALEVLAVIGAGHAVSGQNRPDGGSVANLARTVAIAIEAGVVDVQTRYATWTLGNLTAAIDDHLGDHAAALGVTAAARPVFVATLTKAVLATSGQFGIVQVSATDPVPVPDELRRLGPGGDGRSMFRAHIDERYATTAAVTAEKRLIVYSRTASLIPPPTARVAELAVALRRAGTLSADQAAVITGVLASDRTVDVLVGPAGTGKSHTVGALSAAWATEQGGRVLGLATAEMAARNLAELGLEGMNTAQWRKRFLPDPATGDVHDRLHAGDLVVVDEAGMSTTAELVEISDAAAAAGAKVLLVGDHHQLQPVGAGGMFAHLAAQENALALNTVHRFSHAWEAEASLRLRDGDVDAVAAYADRGRLRTGTLEEMTEHAVRGHMADVLDGKDALLIVGTNRAAAEMSNQIHATLVDLGHVSPDPLATVTVGGVETRIGVGDLIQATHNDRRLRVDPAPGGVIGEVLNKERYTVIGSGDDGVILAQDQRGAIAHLTREYVKRHVILGYAVTAYAAQGVTVDVGRGVLDRDATRESVYVPITRGRENNLLYMVTEQSPDEHDQRRIDDTPAQRLTDILTRSEVAEAALTVREVAERDQASFATLGALINQVSMRASGGRSAAILAELLTEGQMERLQGDDAYERMLTVVYGAELGGHDPRALLAEAVQWRGLEDAESIAKVLHWRIGELTVDREPENGTVEPDHDWTAVADSLAPGPVRDYLHQLGELAADRQIALGTEIALAPPPWALGRLPDVPDQDDIEARRDWEHRAGVVAAYREYRGIPENQSSLGQAPPTQQPFAYALWREATEALDPDPTALTWQHKTDGELYQTREAWALALYHADEYGPRAVGADLAATQRLATEINDDAVLTAAEAAATTDGPQRDDLVEAADRYRALAQAYTEQANAMADEYDARRQWWDDVAPLYEADQAAAAELDRRQLPAWRDRSTPAAGEQLTLLTTQGPAGNRAAEQPGLQREDTTAKSEMARPRDLGPRTVEPGAQEPQACSTPKTIQDVPSADSSHQDGERDLARDAVEQLRRVTRKSELRGLQQRARAQNDQPHETGELDTSYVERAHRDQLAVENERHQQQTGQPEQSHELSHEPGTDYGSYDHDLD